MTRLDEHLLRACTICGWYFCIRRTRSREPGTKSSTRGRLGAYIGQRFEQASVSLLVDEHSSGVSAYLIVALKSCLISNASERGGFSICA